MIFKIFLSFFVLLLLFNSGCSVSNKEGLHNLENCIYTETGTASWYGPKFHGKLTACGEKFDMYSLTAAHRTLSFGTKVKVFNQETGACVIVRINDRGPFAKNRILDLSKTAAAKLGIIDQGTAVVTLCIDPNVSAASPPFKTVYRIQAGSFRNPENASQLKSAIQKIYPNVIIKKYKLKNGIFYRVLVGSFSDRKNAEKKRLKLAEQGFESCFILSETP